MEQENKPRVRLNVKTTTKGECRLDVTVETFGLEEGAEEKAKRIVLHIEALKTQLKLAGCKIAGEDGK
jgi:hypothetical protein